MKHAWLYSDPLQVLMEESLSSGFSTDRSLIFVSTVPHCGFAAGKDRFYHPVNGTGSFQDKPKCVLCCRREYFKPQQGSLLLKEVRQLSDFNVLSTAQGRLRTNWRRYFALKESTLLLKSLSAPGFQRPDNRTGSLQDELKKILCCRTRWFAAEGSTLLWKKVLYCWRVCQLSDFNVLTTAQGRLKTNWRRYFAAEEGGLLLKKVR